MTKYWKRGSTHSVNKTRKDHKCYRCGEIIPKGSKAEYKNLFTGKRGYFHYLRSCHKGNMAEKALELSKLLNETEDNNERE